MRDNSAVEPVQKLCARALQARPKDADALLVEALRRVEGGGSRQDEAYARMCLADITLRRAHGDLRALFNRQDLRRSAEHPESLLLYTSANHTTCAAHVQTKLRQTRCMIRDTCSLLRVPEDREFAVPLRLNAVSVALVILEERLCSGRAGDAGHTPAPPCTSGTCCLCAACLAEVCSDLRTALYYAEGLPPSHLHLVALAALFFYRLSRLAEHGLALPEEAAPEVGAGWVSRSRSLLHRLNRAPPSRLGDQVAQALLQALAVGGGDGSVVEQGFYGAECLFLHLGADPCDRGLLAFTQLVHDVRPVGTLEVADASEPRETPQGSEGSAEGTPSVADDESPVPTSGGCSQPSSQRAARCLPEALPAYHPDHSHRAVVLCHPTPFDPDGYLADLTEHLSELQG